MNKKHYNKSIFFVLLLTSIFLFFVGFSQKCDKEQTDGGIMRTEDGHKFYWEIYNLPIKLRVSTKMPSYYIKGIILAANTWNKKLNYQVFSYEYSMNEYAYEMQGFSVPGKVGVVMEELGKNKYGDIRGRTETVLYAGDLGRIRSAFIIFDLNLNEKEFNNVAIHELGHVLGLKHDLDKTSIMYPNSNDNNKQKIKEEDIINLIKTNNLNISS